ncbi:F-box/kelch-repeat protein At3g23880-like [Salvia miltiorrhiza]|uniref:F-box/kelch-repeat protein At3g23880-like n=1 Tax=Salvia miltiorrhiza TaxID=226208 RepID=UPI0025ABFE9B|nr:F-box/kelch-repeat protein At3g23880-like [Salvia miltiorrhiza]
MPPKRNSKSHNKNKAAAETNAMGDCKLPPDMMIAILARLPVKSLCRFKCVCKPWCKLVSNPDFVKLHTDLSPRARASASVVQSHLLTCSVLGINPNRVSPIEADHPYEIFLDHCNGLVCMGRPAFTDKVILWNPATNLWKVLPGFRTNFGATKMVSLGFGCTAEGDDFKVVRISCLKGKKMKVGVEVYSSKSASWRVLDDVGIRCRVKYPKNHVIVNGDPYWDTCFAERLNQNGEIEEASALLGFDATHMKFKVVPLPRYDIVGNGPIVNWEGSIAMLDCIKKDGDWLQAIDLWCYHEGDGAWILKKRLDVKHDLKVDQCLDCSRSGKIVGGCTNGKLFIFDPKTGGVVVSEVKRGRGCSFQIFGYDESLACVKDMTPAAAALINKEDKLVFNDIEGFFVSSFRHSNGQVACYYALAK